MSHVSQRPHSGGVRKGVRRWLPATAALCAGVASGAASAFIIDVGNPDLYVRFDTQFRYNLGVRMEDLNPDFADSPQYDSTEYFAEKHDVVTNRLDLLSEFDLAWRKDYGFRLSAAAWKDFNYGDTVKVHPGTFNSSLPVAPGVSIPTSASYADISEYENRNYNSYARRYHMGPDGELLDALVFANFDVGEIPVKLKAGKHTVYWGESLFSLFHSISYSQAPLDLLKATTSPGIEAKEVFMPVLQFSGQTLLTDTVSLAVQYMLDWKASRLPAGGTYFGFADAVRADRVFAVVLPGMGPVFIPVGDDVEPDEKRGQFGANLRWTPDWLEGTVGLYYRRFNEVLPWAALRLDPNAGSPSNPLGLPQDLHLAFAEDTELYGISLTRTFGLVSVGAEVSYRRNTALQSSTSFAATGDLAGREGARGSTYHALVNGIYLLPKTWFWEGGNVIAEMAYSRLDEVTKNEALFRGEGEPACVDMAGNAQDKSAGCATDEYVGAQINFTPEWPQVLPGVNLGAPMSIAYDIHGNGASLGGGNEGAYRWSIGLGAMFRNRYEFGLKYNDSHVDYETGPDGLVSQQNGSTGVQNNHGWLSFTFKTTF